MAERNILKPARVPSWHTCQPLASSFLSMPHKRSLLAATSWREWLAVAASRTNKAQIDRGNTSIAMVRIVDSVMLRRKSAEVMTSLRLMDMPAGVQTELGSKRRVDTVRRRHVLYVEGYDPRGAEAYYQLFERSCDRFGKAWPIEVMLDPFAIDSDDFA